jgi:CRP/FNR family transcriptional regulator
MVGRGEIAAIPLFEDLAPALQERLASIASSRTFPPGQTIFGEGDEAAGFHVVRQGKVKVYKLSSEGKEQILHIWGPGAPFGEVPVFTGGAFPAHAQALEDCRTVYIPRAGLVELIRRDPDFALGWLGVLSNRLRRFTEMVEALTLKEVPARLASYLLLLSETRRGADKIDLDITKAQLANLLGATPETLSRILARLAAERLIETEGRRGLRILDRPALEEIASGVRRLLS